MKVNTIIPINANADGGRTYVDVKVETSPEAYAKDFKIKLVYNNPLLEQHKLTILPAKIGAQNNYEYIISWQGVWNEDPDSPTYDETGEYFNFDILAYHPRYQESSAIVKCQAWVNSNATPSAPDLSYPDISEDLPVVTLDNCFRNYEGSAPNPLSITYPEGSTGFENAFNFVVKPLDHWINPMDVKEIFTFDENNVLHWKGIDKVGKYRFAVEAISEEYPNINSNDIYFEINVDYENPTGVTIFGPNGASTSGTFNTYIKNSSGVKIDPYKNDYYQFTANVNPYPHSDDRVTWEYSALDKDGNDASDIIVWDKNNHTISWNEIDSVSNFDIVLKATSVKDSGKIGTYSLRINFLTPQITIQYPLQAAGQIPTIYTTENEAGQTSQPVDAIILPSYVRQDENIAIHIIDDQSNNFHAADGNYISWDAFERPEDTSNMTFKVSASSELYGNSATMSFVYTSDRPLPDDAYRVDANGICSGFARSITDDLNNGCNLMRVPENVITFQSSGSGSQGVFRKTLPSQITRIDLSKCDKMTSISSQQFTFGNNSQIKAVSFPSSLTNIGAYTFCDSILFIADLTACTKMTGLSTCSFYNSGLRTILLPGSVKAFGNGAFRSCGALTYIQWTGLDSADIYVNPKSDCFQSSPGTGGKLRLIDSTVSPYEVLQKLRSYTNKFGDWAII